jgi:hypothetical protein
MSEDTVANKKRHVLLLTAQESHTFIYKCIYVSQQTSKHMIVRHETVKLFTVHCLANTYCWGR